MVRQKQNLVKITSEEHFDKIAADYDYWKRKNWYYYENLKKLFRSIVPPGKRVLEVGCGTGDILASLNPVQGLGIDISRAVIEIAKAKYGDFRSLKFETGDILEMNSISGFEFVIIVDVLEHIENPENFFCCLSKMMGPQAKIIISVANPLWEPILLFAEKLKMKMPEGPHQRLSIKENEEIFLRSGLKIEERGFRLLVPKKIPGADWINSNFYKCRALNGLGFVAFWILRHNQAYFSACSPASSYPLDTL